MTDIALISATVPAFAGGSILAAIGAVTGWHALIDFHDRHTQRPGLAPIGAPKRLAIEAGPEQSPPPAREPIAAIAARPHVEQVSPLEACPLDLGDLEPPALFDADRYALIGAAA